MDNKRFDLDVSNWWPCACVKRDKSGRMTHIALHNPSEKSCKKCKCKRPPASACKAVGGEK